MGAASSRELQFPMDKDSGGCVASTNRFRISLGQNAGPKDKEAVYMTRKRFNSQWTILLLVSLFWACAAGDGRSGPPVHSAALYKATPAVAMTPPNFPNHTIGAVKDAFRLVKHLGDHTVFIYQWSHIDLEVVKLMLKMSRDAQLIPILALSPTTLDQGRKELDLPADIRRRAGTSISFANPVIRLAFKKTAVELARLKPDYYSWVYRHACKSDEILLMEVGWPTGGSGNEFEQLAYIKRLPSLLESVNVSVVAWALLHDISLPEFDADLNTVGLITNQGQKKPGYLEFKTLKNHFR